MAQLEAQSSENQNRWSASQTRAQYASILWLRWRILINGFRRKGGGSELVGRILTVPIAAALLLGPTVGAGFAAWYFAVQGILPYMVWLLWGIFAFSQILNINLGQPGTTFDPTELIRFPMRLRSYVLIRLFFGLLAPANVVVSVISFAVAVGISIAIPSLWLYSLLAMFIFALANVLFTRMVFAWVDRWMSTRRAREVFTALIFLFSIGTQYLNVTFNPAYNHHRHHSISNERINMATRVYHYAEPVLAVLPPNLASDAVLRSRVGDPLGYSARMAGCALYAAAFFGIFALRMRTEFRGENLSDTANAVSKPAAKSAEVHISTFTEIQASQPPKRRLLGLSPPVATVFGKEFLYLRRNTGMFYGLVAPLIMVLLFAGRLAMRQGSWIFPAALAYTLMGLAPFAYNSFGLDGTGTQFFFLAPVPMRDVFLAKNLMNFLTAAAEALAVLVIISYMGAPPSAKIALAGLLWAVGTMLFSTTLGNFRSVSAPKKINLSRAANKQASPLSALISLGVILVAASFGAALLFLDLFFKLHWVLLPALALYAVAGAVTYWIGLRNMDGYALARREAMFEELCKR